MMMLFQTLCEDDEMGGPPARYSDSQGQASEFEIAALKKSSKGRGFKRLEPENWYVALASIAVSWECCPVASWACASGLRQTC